MSSIPNAQLRKYESRTKKPNTSLEKKTLRSKSNQNKGKAYTVNQITTYHLE